jgi:chromosomal replication initiation ATPase DnaA
MNIADFTMHAHFEGHANMVRLQELPADLASFVYAHPTRKLMMDIAREVLAEHHHGISIGELLGDSRARPIVRARQHVWWEIRNQRPDAAITAIARRFNRDHSSIHHGIKMHGARIAETAQ